MESNEDNNNEMFEKMLKDKETTIKFLRRIVKKDIHDIEFIEVEQYETIIEYKFSLLKIALIYDMKKKEEIYLKMIKGGKIKETIFCFWSLMYEEYLKSRKKNKINNVLQKTMITQKTSENYNSKIILTSSNCLEYCAEIDLIELKNFAENKEQKRRLEVLGIEDNQILFIGKKRY